MTIDRHNCEAFFLDYHEGNLTPVEQGEVLLFVEENPDLKPLFEEYEAISLEQENISFPGKEPLKKKYTAEGIESLLSFEITPNNCEQFFIAYTEGQLSSGRIARMDSFLANNPNYKKEFELFKKAKLSAEIISFEEKETLKKSLITKDNCEEYFIRSAEKDLGRAEEEQLKLFLQKNPEYKKEFELFAKAVLPAEQVVFAGKSFLKKKERKPVFVSIFSQRAAYYAAAAVVLLLIGLFFIFTGNEKNQQEFADKTNNGKTIVNVKKESVEPVNENKQEPALEKQEVNAEQPAISSQRPATSHRQPEARGEEIKLQPVIIEDQEILVAEKELERPAMMEAIAIAERKEEKKEENKEETHGQSQAVAAVLGMNSQEDQYQTIGSFARKQIKKALGIQKANPCEEEDKLTVWDLAMAAKNGVQNLIGTKVVDVNKSCGGSGTKVEYVFSAGGFEISRKAKNKM